MLSNHKDPVNGRPFPSRLTIRYRNDNMAVGTLLADEEGSMQFHLGGGRNIRWTEARRTRWVVDILRERFQSKRFFQKGLIFEAEMFDMRNGVKQRHMHGQYRIVSDMEEFWKKFEKEIQRFFSRVDGEAKNFDHSIFEIKIGSATFFRHKFENNNETRIVLVLAFSKIKEPTPL